MEIWDWAHTHTYTRSPTGHCHSAPLAFPGAQNVNNAHGDGFPTAASLGSSLCSDPVNTVSLRAEHLLFVPPINEVMVQIPYIYEVLVWKIIFGRITPHGFPTFCNQGGWQCVIFLEQSYFFFKEKRIFPPQVHLLHQFWTNGCTWFRFVSSLTANVPSCGTCLQGNEYGFQWKLF